MNRFEEQGRLMAAITEIEKLHELGNKAIQENTVLGAPQDFTYKEMKDCVEGLRKILEPLPL